MREVRVVGSGLIGTSIALALAGNGIDVEMIDLDQRRAKLAQDLVGEIPTNQPDLVVVAVPTSSLREVIAREFQLNPRASFIDVGSVKTKPLGEIQSIEGLATRFCGTHPMAGREIGGPEAARADLFVGRPWIYTPAWQCQADVVESVIEFIERLGGIPIKMSPEEHDSAVALISHLPQISASLLAKQLLLAPQEWLALAGAGLRDSTRIAASDPGLWKEILGYNREQLRPLLYKMSEDLSALIAELDNEEAIAEFIAQGQAGRARIPGKHGGKARDYFYLPIVIEDKPGQLGALFDECAAAKVNIEDLSIEHSPGQFTGLITLALSKDDGEHLAQHLKSHGWNVHLPR